MSAYAKSWAKKARVELMETLGNKCAWCGSIQSLTFDCIKPTGDDHHKGSTDQRMCFYRKEHRVYDNVQILCASCNGKKGAAVIDFRKPEFNWSMLGMFAPA